MRKLFLALMAAVFLLMTSEVALQKSAKFSFVGKVSYVLDADILVLTDDKNLDVLVRLKGIDCPDSGQAYYNNAKDFVEDLLGNKKVTVHCDSSDYFGRTFGEIVLADGRNLNKELLRFGLAWHYVRYSKDAEYAALEKSAREARLGLWKYNDPVPPWVFRRDDTLKTDMYVGTFLEMPTDLPKETVVKEAGSARNMDVPKSNEGTPLPTANPAYNSGKLGAKTPARQRIYITTEKTFGPDVNDLSKYQNVWLCNSRHSHTYHRVRHCTAVADCEDELIEVTHWDAVKRYHRNGCRSCY
jgi:endonuclease YncB( thermonuclease family)